MTTEDAKGWRARCCEALGLKDGARADEIRSAYRDLAKVWHPDRFTHDPRLQEKAQEKLKEINEAYRQLLAGTPPPRAARPTQREPHSTRDAHATRHEPHATPHEPRSTRYDDAGATRHESQATRGARGGEAGGEAARARKGFDWRLLVPAVAFCATFALFTPRLLSSNRADAGSAGGAATQAQTGARDDITGERSLSKQVAGGQDVDGAEQREANARKTVGRLPRTDSPAATGGPQDVAAREKREIAARAPLPTVGVTVDPATNLLARPGCPSKLRVTFPAGNEPHAYCDAAHGRPEPAAAQEKEQNKSRLKSLAGRVASPSKWLSGRDAPGEPAKKVGAREQSPEQD